MYALACGDILPLEPKLPTRENNLARHPHMASDDCVATCTIGIPGDQRQAGAAGGEDQAGASLGILGRPWFCVQGSALRGTTGGTQPVARTCRCAFLEGRSGRLPLWSVMSTGAHGL